MKTIRPYVEEVVKITCSCSCEDSIQFNRYLESFKFNDKEQEEIYVLDMKKDSERWPFKLKFKMLWDPITKIQSYKDGKGQYYNSNMINKEQAQRLYDTLIEDIENFDESIADFILQGIEEFSPIKEKVNEYTLLIGNFNCDLMWIGVDGSELESPPNLKAGFYPYDVIIGWRIAKSVKRRDLFRYWRHYFKTGQKYEITEFDAVLGKEDMVVILGSLKYILNNTFKNSK